MNAEAATRAGEAAGDAFLPDDETPTPEPAHACPFGLKVGEAIAGQPRGGFNRARDGAPAIMDDLTEAELRAIILGEFVVLDDGTHAPAPEGLEPAPVASGPGVVPFRL